MFANEGLRFLVSAEVLALFANCVLWVRVWSAPTIDRLRLAALCSAAFVAFRAISLSAAIVVTTSLR
jgi:hypothetical protein